MRKVVDTVSIAPQARVDSNVVNITGCKNVTFTVRVTYPIGQTGKPTMRVYFSPDGINWDTYLLWGWNMDVYAGETSQYSIRQNMPGHGFCFLRIMNLEKNIPLPLTNVQAWMTVGIDTLDPGTREDGLGATIAPSQTPDFNVRGKLNIREKLPESILYTNLLGMPANTTQEGGYFSIEDVETLFLTVRAAWPADHDENGLFDIYFSPDGINYDTITLLTTIIPCEAWQEVQRTIELPITRRGYLKYRFDNRAQNVSTSPMRWKTWATFKYKERGVVDLRAELGNVIQPGESRRS